MDVNEITNYLSEPIKKIVVNFKETGKITEIRIRLNKPLQIITMTEDFITEYIVTNKDIKEIMEYASDYSLYAYEDEMKNGYLTIKGGNRLGICGRAISENGQIKNLKNITSLNLRISREKLGCASTVVDSLYIDEKRIHNTLFISPPGCGKTTILRDTIRLISNGNGMHRGQNVAVVDERCELSGGDLGVRTDVLLACPKSEGMMMLLRSMSPKVLAVDEIGSGNDANAIMYAINSGCSIVATIHAYSLEEFFAKKGMEKLIDNRVFNRLVLLSDKSGPGTIEGIFNGEGINV